MAKKKAVKKKKVQKLSTIRNRIFRKWSLIVRDEAANSCEYCGIKKGELNQNDKPVKIDAHHIVSRYMKNSPLKFDRRNGVAVNPTCHKFGEDSFHRSPATTMHWFRINRGSDYDFILENFHIKVDLDNRIVLAEIERCIDANELLDYDNLLAVEEANPRKKKAPKPEFEGSLFDEVPEPKITETQVKVEKWLKDEDKFDDLDSDEDVDYEY